MQEAIIQEWTESTDAWKSWATPVVMDTEECVSLNYDHRLWNAVRTRGHESVT